MKNWWQNHIKCNMTIGMYMLDLNEPQMIDMSQTAAHYSHSAPSESSDTLTQIQSVSFFSTRFLQCAFLIFAPTTRP